MSPLFHKAGALIKRLCKAMGLGGLMVLSTYFGICILCLLIYSFIFPPTTGVHIQRRIEAWFSQESYEKRFVPVGKTEISIHALHAVVAAEDTRFFDHKGIDWETIKELVEDKLEDGGAVRGGSTISQQLVKNLFMTTHRSYIRKGLEVPLVYLTEWILSKDRILLLYINVIEWDRGVYGIEAASQHYYNQAAAPLTRSQAAALAACIPNPRQRSPQKMGWYRDIILQRMRTMGW